MLYDLSGTHPIQMKLALLKPFVRWGYAVNCPGMGAGHGRDDNDALVLRNHLVKIESEFRESFGQPPAGCNQTCRASESPIGSIGIILRFLIDEIRRDYSIRRGCVAGFEHAKGFEHHLLVLFRAHRTLHLQYRHQYDGKPSPEVP